jgi:hypothetical protein
VDIYDPLAARTRPTTATTATTATAETQVQQQPPPSQEPPMPNDQNMPTPFVAPPCPTCAPAPHWPWILALIVGGGLGWYIGSRKKARG